MANETNPIFKKIPLLASKKYGNFLIGGGGPPSSSHLEMAHFASIALNFGVGTSKSSGTGVPQNGRTSILRTYLAHGEMVVQAKEWNSWNKRDKDQPILLFHLPLGSNLGSNKIAITPPKSAFFLSWKKTAVHQNDVFLLCRFLFNSNFRDAVNI